MREVCQRCSLLPPVSLSLSLSLSLSSFSLSLGFSIRSLHTPLPFRVTAASGSLPRTESLCLSSISQSVLLSFAGSSLLSAPFPDTRRVSLSLSLSVRFSIRDSDSTRLDSTRLDSTRLDTTRFDSVRGLASQVESSHPSAERVPLPRSSILRNQAHTSSLLSLSLPPPTPTHPPLLGGGVGAPPVRSGTLFCNIVLLEPRCVSSLGKYDASNIKKYTTLAPLLYPWSSLPAVYLILSLSLLSSLSLSLSRFAVISTATRRAHRRLTKSSFPSRSIGDGTATRGKKPARQTDDYAEGDSRFVDFSCAAADKTRGDDRQKIEKIHGTGKYGEKEGRGGEDRLRE